MQMKMWTFDSSVCGRFARVLLALFSPWLFAAGFNVSTVQLQMLEILAQFAVYNPQGIGSN